MDAGSVKYSFVTTWFVGTPIDRVWEVIQDTGRWPEWWRYVRGATLLEPGDGRGVGALWRLEWGTALPYQIVFESRVTRVEPPNVLEAAVSGELNGIGRWSLTPRGADGAETVVRYDWNVGTGKRWMNVLAPLARPLFGWNHNVVMDEGGRGLARRLDAPVLAEE